MAINYVPGKGWVMDVPGTDRTVVLGSPEEQAMTQSHYKRQREFADKHRFKYSRDYRDTWDRLFGSYKGEYSRSNSAVSPTFGYGPNSNWMAAMSDRMQKRRAGDFNSVGHYEARTQTSSADWQAKMYARNNAIEDMMRRGYDTQQIADYLEGRRDVTKDGPSWNDYKRELESGGDTSWMDRYYIGKPGMSRAEAFSDRLNTGLQLISDKVGQAFGMLSDGEYPFNARRAEEPKAVVNKAKPSVTVGMLGKYFNKGKEK